MTFSQDNEGKIKLSKDISKLPALEFVNFIHLKGAAPLSQSTLGIVT